MMRGGEHAETREQPSICRRLALMGKTGEQVLLTWIARCTARKNYRKVALLEGREKLGDERSELLARGAMQKNLRWHWKAARRMFTASGITCDARLCSLHRAAVRMNAWCWWGPCWLGG